MGLGLQMHQYTPALHTNTILCTYKGSTVSLTGRYSQLILWPTIDNKAVLASASVIPAVSGQNHKIDQIL